MGYHDDHRVRAQRDREGRNFDEKRMTLTIEVSNPKFEMTEDETEPETLTLVLPARFEVCETCNGKGSRVNPSIDSNGISGEEFDEDPDFAESYYRGDYDVPCYRCGGARVSPVVDETRARPGDLAAYEAHLEEQADYDAECRSEARYFGYD